MAKEITLTLDIPGGHGYSLSLDVLLKHIITAAGKNKITVHGGRTQIRVDGDGRIYIDEHLEFTPKALIPHYEPYTVDDVPDASTDARIAAGRALGAVGEGGR